MNNDMFQKIFDVLIEFLPNNWSKLVYIAEYYEGSFSMKCYVKIQDSNYICCFDMDNFDNNKFMISSVELNKVISANRLQLSEDKRWMQLL